MHGSWVKDIGCQHGQWLDGNFHCNCDSSLYRCLQLCREAENNDRWRAMLTLLFVVPWLC